jgi:hypothetical protein
MAIAERFGRHSLWVSSLLPDNEARWFLLDAGSDRFALERQAKSLSAILERRRLTVAEGLEPPPWKPVL